MTTWVSIYKRDSYFPKIVERLEGHSSLTWTGVDIDFYVWLDIDTGNIVIIHIPAEQTDAWSQGGLVQTVVFSAAIPEALRFYRRFSESFAGRHSLDGAATPTQDEALEKVKVGVQAAFRIA